MGAHQNTIMFLKSNLCGVGKLSHGPENVGSSCNDLFSGYLCVPLTEVSAIKLASHQYYQLGGFGNPNCLITSQSIEFLHFCEIKQNMLNPLPEN